MQLNPWVPAQIDSPIGAAYDLVPERAGRRPLLDLSQASPPYPPSPAVLDHLQRCLGEPSSVPRAADLEKLITPRTRAVVLVTPGNPTGVTIPPAEIVAFAGVARRHDIALVLDETYRSFRHTDGPAHALYADSDWSDHLIGLFSFSKEFAIPGYRVGAVVAGPTVGREMAKLMDCVAVCAPKIGQEAAWAGLTQATGWRAERVAEMAVRRASFRGALADLPGGFEVLSCGGYFGWLRHPFRGEPTPQLARRLLVDQDLLLLPGTAFGPADNRALRVSISGVDQGTAADLADRLRAAAT